MLFSTYQRLNRSKYFLYSLIDLAIAYGIYQYVSDTFSLFDWVRFIEIYLFILMIQLIFVARDALTNALFLKLNEHFLVDGIVADFRKQGFPKSIDGVDSPTEYFEAIIQDPTTSLSLKLNASKYLHLLQAMQSSASGWVNHYVYTTLLERSIHQHSRDF